MCDAEQVQVGDGNGNLKCCPKKDGATDYKFDCEVTACNDTSQWPELTDDGDCVTCESLNQSEAISETGHKKKCCLKQNGALGYAYSDCRVTGCDDTSAWPKLQSGKCVTCESISKATAIDGNGQRKCCDKISGATQYEYIHTGHPDFYCKAAACDDTSAWPKMQSGRCVTCESIHMVTVTNEESHKTCCEPIHGVQPSDIFYSNCSSKLTPAPSTPAPPTTNHKGENESGGATESLGESSGLSTGAVVGITVGALVLLGFSVAGALLLMRMKGSSSSSHHSDSSSAQKTDIEMTARLLLEVPVAEDSPAAEQQQQSNAEEMPGAVAEETNTNTRTETAPNAEEPSEKEV